MITEEISTLKTTTIGKISVGKTSLMTRVIYGHCNVKIFSTVGASFLMHKIDDIKYNIWDTAGQERYRSLMPIYFRDSKLVIFVFDTTDMTTLCELDKYSKELEGIDDYYIIIVGNKIDLLTDVELDSVIESVNAKIKEYPLSYRVYCHVLVSAKSGENFDAFMEKLKACGKLMSSKISQKTSESKKSQTNISQDLTIEDSCCS